MNPVIGYMEENLVLFLSNHVRNDVLKALVEKIDAVKHLPDKEAYYHAITQRETLVSTGIGMGVAIPHAKMQGYDDFFIAIGILQKGVDWHSLDFAPVRLVFMIGGPDDKQTEYLQLLSNLTLLIKNEEIRKNVNVEIRQSYYRIV